MRRTARFATTQWNIVLAAGSGESAESLEAFAALCEKYWFPLYFYIRKRGYDVEDAQDLTQGFFTLLFEKDRLKNLRREGGRFRAFLLRALNNYVSNERDRAHAQKRGAGQVPFSLDYAAAEGRYCLEAADWLTPEKVFEQRWAEELLARAMKKLRQTLAAQGNRELFDELKPFLTGEAPRAPYGEVADRLQMSEGAVKVAVHRMRRRLGGCIRDEIAQTLADPEEVDEEIRHLFSVFSQGAEKIV